MSVWASPGEILFAERFPAAAPPFPTSTSQDELEVLREGLKAGLYRFQDFALPVLRGGPNGTATVAAM